MNISNKVKILFLDHENLRGKIDILENYDYVADVTPKTFPFTG